MEKTTAVMVHWLCTSYISLPAHRTRHVISQFNSCSRDKSRTGLKRHRRGYDTRRRSSQAYPSLCRVLLGSPGLKILIPGPLSSSYPCITTVLRILLTTGTIALAWHTILLYQLSGIIK